ncbi:albumin-binding GA domain-containing protein [Streptococcus halichoeri]|uniref:albumin-binding GA domain-containing protein n=1 Tax=Streptococcus halichoeri TaxID=254785 RepID=UPI0013585FEF|nr:albumin-binding GA domain-containing protein [Streptococcus halichoeri]
MENKKMQSYLRKSAFGIASVSAAVLAGVTSVQAAEPSAAPAVPENGSFQLMVAKQQAAEEAEAKANEALSDAKAKALDNVDAKTNLSTDEKTNFAAELQDAKSMEAVNRLNTQINKDVIATNLQGMAEGINAMTGDVKTPADFKLEFAKDDAKKALKAAGVSDFYIKKIDGAKTVEGVKSLKDFILNSLAKKDQPTPTPEVKPAPTPEVKPAPETKPAEPKAPGMPQVKPGKAAPAADAPAAKSNVKHLASNPVAMKSAANQLPSTGDSANPFFTAAAFAVMTSAGMVTLAAKRKEN